MAIWLLLLTVIFQDKKLAPGEGRLGEQQDQKLRELVARFSLQESKLFFFFFFFFAEYTKNATHLTEIMLEKKRLKTRNTHLQGHRHCKVIGRRRHAYFVDPLYNGDSTQRLAQVDAW